MKTDLNGKTKTWICFILCRGFSVIDLLEDAHSHKLFALKRITCHGTIDERVALREVEVMRTFRHRYIVPLEEYSMITIGHHVESQDPITEMLLVMPFYRVSQSQFFNLLWCKFPNLLYIWRMENIFTYKFTDFLLWNARFINFPR